jgi:hypothetical protein
VYQSHTGCLTGLWFLPKLALGLNTDYYYYYINLFSYTALLCDYLWVHTADNETLPCISLKCKSITVWLNSVLSLDEAARHVCCISHNGFLSLYAHTTQVSSFVRWGIGKFTCSCIVLIFFFLILLYYLYYYYYYYYYHHHHHQYCHHQRCCYCCNFWILQTDRAVMCANKAHLVSELHSLTALHDNVLELKWMYFTSLFLIVRVLFTNWSISAVPVQNVYERNHYEIRR